MLSHLFAWLFKLIIPLTFLMSSSHAFTPASYWGMSSVFIEGKTMLVHGGATTANNATCQTFSLDLSTNWTAAAPAFTPLTDGFQDYGFFSSLLNDNDTWFLVTDQIAWTYYIHNDTWTMLGGYNLTNKAKGLAAVTNPKTGLVYIVNGLDNNGSVSMQVWNAVADSISSVPTHPKLANVVNFAVSWSTRRGSVLIHGGVVSQSNVIQRTLYEYTPNVSQGWWTLPEEKGDLPPARKSHCMVPAFGGTKMVLFGGHDQTGNALGDVYLLDVDTLQWTKGTDGGPQAARGSAACAVTNDLLVVWGGRGSGLAPISNNLTIVYNMKTGTWQDYYTSVRELPSNTTTPTTPTGSNTGNMGGIIGGIVGGVALIAGAIGFLFFRRRRAVRDMPPTFSSKYGGDLGSPPNFDPFRNNGRRPSYQVEPLIGSPNSIPKSPEAIPGEFYGGDYVPPYSSFQAGIPNDEYMDRSHSVHRPSSLVPGRSPQAITEWQEDLTPLRSPQNA